VKRNAFVDLISMLFFYLEVDTDGGDHVTDKEESSSNQGSLARTNTLQPGTVDGSGASKASDGNVEGNDSVVLVSLLTGVDTVDELVDGVVEDGPSVERTADGLEDEGSGEEKPAVEGHAEDFLLALDLLGTASSGSVIVVVVDEPQHRVGWGV
jgi:hypothetical protein